ncbi:hypothetical protein BG74_00950 [Sodalis-like endosymbiont of Proechinophthirus fluctus]|nr:hypothetical protein BG74_00950 [Sodalis-like endosymbiont of Proechinophthirus fluctus]
MAEWCYLSRVNRKRSRTCRKFHQLGLADIDIEQVVASFPIAVQEFIEIVKSLISRPKVIILDEPRTCSSWLKQIVFQTY